MSNGWLVEWVLADHANTNTSVDANTGQSRLVLGIAKQNIQAYRLLVV